jgi:hypothetical protein
MTWPQRRRISIERRERNSRNLTQGAAVGLEPRHGPHTLDRCDTPMMKPAFFMPGTTTTQRALSIRSWVPKGLSGVAASDRLGGRHHDSNEPTSRRRDRLCHRRFSVLIRGVHVTA